MATVELESVMQDYSISITNSLTILHHCLDLIFYTWRGHDSVRNELPNQTHLSDLLEWHDQNGNSISLRISWQIGALKSSIDDHFYWIVVTHVWEWYLKINVYIQTIDQVIHCNSSVGEGTYYIFTFCSRNWIMCPCFHDIIQKTDGILNSWYLVPVWHKSKIRSSQCEYLASSERNVSCLPTGYNSIVIIHATSRNTSTIPR